MGYTKINQFGDVTEIYEYENDLKRKPGVDALRASRLISGPDNSKATVSNVRKERAKKQRAESKRKGIYKRSESSIRRSRNNFFRLVHHNNYHSLSITFITLTLIDDVNYRQATRYVSDFFSRVRGAYPEVPLSYISVPEITKKGRFHFHLLVYDLPPGTAERERKTRNFQRLWQRGYVDLVPATYRSKGIAGYMAKYMAKAIGDEKYETTRGYNCSRNIKKIRSAGSNAFDYYDTLVDVDNSTIETNSFEVPFLGACKYQKITHNI